VPMATPAATLAPSPMTIIAAATTGVAPVGAGEHGPAQ